jgi:hypothetical protein
MGDTPGHALRQAVVARHGSIHAFLKRNPELTRSTVYQVLGDRYPGNMARQMGVIRTALEGFSEAEAQAPWQLPDVEELGEVLLAAKCAKCRRQDRRGCRGCRIQTGREAQAVQEFLAKTR